MSHEFPRLHGWNWSPVAYQALSSGIRTYQCYWTGMHRKPGRWAPVHQICMARGDNLPSCAWVESRGQVLIGIWSFRRLLCNRAMKGLGHVADALGRSLLDGHWARTRKRIKRGSLYLIQQMYHSYILNDCTIMPGTENHWNMFMHMFLKAVQQKQEQIKQQHTGAKSNLPSCFEPVKYNTGFTAMQKCPSLQSRKWREDL